jgi:hypothetical protein
MKKMLAAVAFCLCVVPLSTNPQATAAPQESHWYYCNATEIQNEKNTYFSTTFSSSLDPKTLLSHFSDFVAQHYDLPANGLWGSCYGARRYKPDTFASVEEQRSQHMNQSNKHRQNVIPTGWTGD